MALYTIADLHLSVASHKPMDVFGARWTDHTSKLVSRWSSLVSQEDTVIIPGDISWAMTLEEASLDFKLIDSLPGRKIIGKGNHDYWWTTVSKMKRYLDSIGVTTVDFLFNNAFLTEEAVICGTRGWYIEEKLQDTPDPTDYEKLVSRECQRLDLSLREGEELRNDAEVPLLAFLHFPPVFGDFVCEPIIDTLLSHNVSRCYYGHIHGKYLTPHTLEYRGVSLSIISSDYLDFTPQRIFI